MVWCFYWIAGFGGSRPALRCCLRPRLAVGVNLRVALRAQGAGGVLRALAAGADEQHGRACVEVGGGSGEQLRHGDMLAGKGRGEGGAFGGAADVDNAPVLRECYGEFRVDGRGGRLRLVIAGGAVRGCGFAAWWRSRIAALRPRVARQSR